MFRSATKELFLNAGVHGIKYLVISKRKLFEKIVWMAILAASLVSVLWVSLLAWQGFSMGMVVTLTDSTNYPIWNVPFPSVTICDFNKISRRKAYQVARHLVQTGNMSRDEVANGLKYLMLLSSQADMQVSPRTLWAVQDMLERNNYTAHALYQQITPTCAELIHRCLWKGEETKCEAIFEQIPTPMGYCCTFNYYALKNHKFSGYLARRSPSKPRRVSACGYTAGIEMLVHINTDDYFASPHGSSGINVKVHDPYNYADSSWPDAWFSSDSIGFISLTPEAFKASQDVKEMRLEDRQCALPHELPLKTFGYYTYANCLTECRMKLIYRYCGCIPFYVYNPNESVWSSVPGLSDIDDISEEESSQSRGECKSCIPECEGVRYYMEMSTGVLSRKHSMNKLNLFGYIDESNHSAVRVFPSDLVITRHQRFLKHHWHTLFALFGGLVGLFTGMSFITGFEIVYYMSIRMFVNLYRAQTKSTTYRNKNRPFGKSLKTDEQGKGVVS